MLQQRSVPDQPAPAGFQQLEFLCIEAVTGETGLGDFEALAKLHTLSGVPVPPAVDGLETAPVRHRTSVAAKDMQAAVEDYLGL